MARAYGAKSISPGLEPIFGVDEEEAPFQGSAYVEWYYEDGSSIPQGSVPPEGSDAHECPRREPAAQAQLVDFLTTGTVNQYCDGVCGGLVSECN